MNAFQQLVEEEQKHINFIQNQLALLAGQPGDTNYGSALEQAGFFSQRAQSEFIDQSVAEAMVPNLPVLRMAYLIERDFAEFYEFAANQAEGDAKQVLTMLSQWEQGHERLFKYFYDKVFVEYSNMPWGG